jgi:nitrogen-specific signal transduction histidine kinase
MMEAKKRIKIEKEYDANLFLVTADRKQITIVFTNLIEHIADKMKEEKKE